MVITTTEHKPRRYIVNGWKKGKQTVGSQQSASNTRE